MRIKNNFKKPIGLFFLCVLTCSLAWASIILGAKTLPFNILYIDHSASFSQEDSKYLSLVLKSREIRTVIGLLAGAALALSACLAQAILRNPLAEPGLLGINAGATLAILTFPFLPIFSHFNIFIQAFLGAIFSTILFYFISGARRNNDPLRLLLTGATLNIFLFACVECLLFLAPQNIEYYHSWMIGSLNKQLDFPSLWLLFFLCSAIFISFTFGPALNIMIFNDTLSTSLGVNSTHIRLVTLLFINFLAACATALAGPITFIGLCAPHFMRFFIGNDYRFLLPYSAFFGACLLLLSDIIARIVLAPQEIQVGIVTSLIGAPMLYFLIKKQSYENI